MKKLLYILPVFLLTSCFFTVGDLPPDFCDISQSHVQLDGSEESVRCGDASIAYTYNERTQLYKLRLNTSNMVPYDNGSRQDTDLVLTLTSYDPITAGDYLNDASKGWQFSFSWYDYYISQVEASVVKLSIASDSTVSATIRFSALLDQINYSEKRNFEYLFRNLELPSTATPSFE